MNEMVEYGTLLMALRDKMVDEVYLTAKKLNHKLRDEDIFDILVAIAQYLRIKKHDGFNGEVRGTIIEEQRKLSKGE